MGQQRIANRTLISVIGVVCIILTVLVAGMVPALVNYTTIIGNKDNDIASLNFQIKNLYSQIKQYLTDVNGNKTLLSKTQTWLNDNVTSYNTQIADLQKIVNLQDMILLYNDSVLVPNPIGPAVWYNIPSIAPELWINLEGHPIPIKYAGYLVVNIVLSSSSSTSVQVDYSSNQLSYDNTVNTGSAGNAYFPILPTTNLNINLLNTDSMNLNITRVTITYYY